jgi:Uma2 family endonuclease
MTIEVRRRPFTADEYHRMAEAGVLAEDDRVELIDGEIIEMTPIGARHARCVMVLSHLLHHQAGDQFIVSVQNPIRLSNRSEPQPDVAVLLWRDDFYPELPGAHDVALVIEVAETSAATDRAVKIPAYGRAGIVEAWLVDLAADRIEVHLEPSPAGYARIETYSPGQTLSATVAHEIEVEVSKILGSRPS